MSYAKIGRFKIKLPRSAAARRALGIGLCAGGTFSFLPVLGLWMLPLGLVVLSADSHGIRKFRRRLDLKVATWRRTRRRGRADTSPTKKGGPG